ncbi:MBL fold metallo-hydrolase [Chloroflexota bacterium]
MNEVTPGIYRLKSPVPGGSFNNYVNAYLVKGNDGHLLVDTGWNTEEAFNSIKEQLVETGIGFKDISQVVITHRHPDHYGLVSKLRQISPAKIALHYLEKEFLERRYTYLNEFIREMEHWLDANGLPEEEMASFRPAALGSQRLLTPTSPDITLRGGETVSTGLFNFKVLWTPGHAVGHICLYEPTRKILLSGDHVLPDTTSNISLYPQQAGSNPLGDFLDSLNALRPLEINIILPGHEEPFTDLPTRIEELFQHHKRRKSEILEALKNKPKTTYQVATAITWMLDRGGTSWYNLVPIDKRMAMLEAISHLESMVVDGSIDTFHENSTIYYQLS